MRKSTVRLFLLVVLSACTVTFASAEPRTYTADKWHTRIYFSVDHMGLSNYGGRFTEFDIQFQFDEEDFANSHV